MLLLRCNYFSKIKKGNVMDEKVELTKEMVDKLSVEELAELKVEVDNLVNNIDDAIAECEDAINS